MNTILQQRIEEAAAAIAPFNRMSQKRDYFVKGAVFALQNQWISIEEGLPEIKEHFVSKDVLCIYSDGQMGFSRLKENLFGQKWFEYESEESVVTHWMLIPQLKGGENE